MKYILLFMLIGLIISCGPNREQIKEEERMRMEVREELWEEKMRKESETKDAEGERVDISLDIEEINPGQIEFRKKAQQGNLENSEVE